MFFRRPVCPIFWPIIGYHSVDKLVFFRIQCPPKRKIREIFKTFLERKFYDLRVCNKVERRDHLWILIRGNFPVLSLQMNWLFLVHSVPEVGSLYYNNDRGRGELFLFLLKISRVSLKYFWNVCKCQLMFKIRQKRGFAHILVRNLFKFLRTVWVNSAGNLTENGGVFDFAIFG
jgi:hypothetical protein